MSSNLNCLGQCLERSSIKCLIRPLLSFNCSSEISSFVLINHTWGNYIRNISPARVHSCLWKRCKLKFGVYRGMASMLTNRIRVVEESVHTFHVLQYKHWCTVPCRDDIIQDGQHWPTPIKVMCTRVYLERTVTRFMQPMPILTPPSTKSFLGSNPFRPAHIL